MRIGACNNSTGAYEFTVWAPFVKGVDLKIVSPREKIVPMEKDALGYWRTVVDDISGEMSYVYRLEADRDRPDPASHFQPSGVHGSSQAVNHSLFKWKDQKWKVMPLSEMIMYELHVGTFTREGTFDAVVGRLPQLRDLGINAIEIMPVSQFPGGRNWGYDGAYPFAVQNSYGGPDGLKRLVNACHRSGMAVILDVVYNHLGPEGNYLWDYGPYFTDRYKTPWGMAINFDGAYSNEVRNFFLENALHWFREYHIDALRLDAVHGITDFSARTFLQELADAARDFSQRERNVYLIAESDLNDSRIVRPEKTGGYGIHAQWSDDFHHSLHTLLTGENDGYYMDFGTTDHMAKALKEGFVYTGEYSEYRRRNHGNSSKDLPPARFVVSSQNHDQIGNRVFGERLTALVSFESLKLAAGVVLLSPYIPLLFMGEEYGEENPFLYFVSHSDPDLVASVRKGRSEEFKAFLWKGETPDPQSIGTFQKSKIQWEKRKTANHKILLKLYKYLIRLRREMSVLASPDRRRFRVEGRENDRTLLLTRWKDEHRILCVFNFHHDERTIDISVPRGGWKRILDSSEKKWKGPGPLTPVAISDKKTIAVRGRSFVLYGSNVP
jgi:maltooligosyltrehalose trehalohydrolase